MKKVLVIANLTHASPRIPGLTSFFPESGYEVTIVTPPQGANASERLGFPENFTKHAKIIEADFRGDVFWFWRKVLKQLGYHTGESLTEQLKESFGETNRKSIVDTMMTAYQTVFAYPDVERTWRKKAIKTAGELLEKNKYDVILSTSPVPTTHIIAAALKKKFNVPWVADFRDTWTQNPVYEFPEPRKKIETLLEKKVIRQANEVVTVSKAYADSLAALHARPVHVIPNGYTELPDSQLNVGLTKKFTITYTGVIYQGQQDPIKILEAVKGLIDDKKMNHADIEIRFYGKKSAWLQAEIDKRGLSHIAEQKGTVSRIESRKRQKESQVLLFLNWEDTNNKGLSHLKLYEYLASQRPVLATGGFGGDDSESILKETQAGSCARNVNEIKAWLSSAYEQFQKTSAVAYAGKETEIKKYSYRERAKQLTSVLDLVLH